MPSRVLVADDSPIALTTVSRRVRVAGFDVVTHDSVATACTVDPRSLGCALLDFDLGDGYGTEIAAHLRAAAPSLPIAFFTSTTEPEAQERAAAFGPVFAKPADLEAAIKWIESQLPAG